MKILMHCYCYLFVVHYSNYHLLDTGIKSNRNPKYEIDRHRNKSKRIQDSNSNSKELCGVL